MLTLTFSDGIARVHGMANVQAEELVEYVPLDVGFGLWSTPFSSIVSLTRSLIGSPLASRACA